MSKYTTELRFICEEKAGYTASQGYNTIGTIIEAARPYIFSFNYPIFDVTHKPELETKILKHYYTREISEETFGLWQLRLEEKMNLIMPYYNKLYYSESLSINPLRSKNYTLEHTGEDSSASESSTSSTSNTSSTSTGNSRNLYSDTPQSTIQNLDDEKYVTNYRKINDSTSNTGSGTGSQTGESESSGENHFIRTYTGSDIPEADLIKKYRDIIVNIDRMIIKDLEDLFFGLW